LFMLDHILSFLKSVMLMYCGCFYTRWRENCKKPNTNDCILVNVIVFVQRGLDLAVSVIWITHVFRTARINLSSFTKDFRVRGINIEL
jgi:hypothetical protein